VAAADEAAHERKSDDHGLGRSLAHGTTARNRIVVANPASFATARCARVPGLIRVVFSS
jgi:hypothetical protein